MSVENNLKKYSIVLDEAAAPAGNYVPFVISNNLVFISGQLPFRNGIIPKTGIVGNNVSIEEAIEMSKLCALSILSQLKVACDGDLNKIKKVVKLGGFVASSPKFTDQPRIINSASEIMVKIFGENGKHSRFAVGVSSLPLNAPVEIEGIFEII
tara:strand:- start:145 stop:606 length:462 start_codon:yes stop_codon:yes gene_type:complete